MILGYCRFCHSSNTKVSYAYPSDYYCVDCKKGGDLKTILSKKELDDVVCQKQRKFNDDFPFMVKGVLVTKNEEEEKESGKLRIFLEKQRSVNNKIISKVIDNGICDYE